MPEVIEVSIVDEVKVVVGGSTDQIDLAKECFSGREGIIVRDKDETRSEYFGTEAESKREKIALDTAIGKLDFEVDSKRPSSGKNVPGSWELLSYLRKLLKHKLS